MSVSSSSVLFVYSLSDCCCSELDFFPVNAELSKVCRTIVRGEVGSHLFGLVLFLIFYIFIAGELWEDYLSGIVIIRNKLLADLKMENTYLQ